MPEQPCGLCGRAIRWMTDRTGARIRVDAVPARWTAATGDASAAWVVLISRTGRRRPAVWRIADYPHTVPDGTHVLVKHYCPRLPTALGDLPNIYTGE